MTRGAESMAERKAMERLKAALVGCGQCRHCRKRDSVENGTCRNCGYESPPVEDRIAVTRKAGLPETARNGKIHQP